jgi:O-antigen/teichoic acid export membrane protein
MIRNRLWGALSLSVINQILTSGTNFIFGIYLLRTLPADQFGLYGIGFACVLFVFGIGHFAFLIPMAVRIQDKQPECRQKYAATMLAIVLIFGLIVVTLTIIGHLALIIAFPIGVQYSHYVASVVFSSVAYLIKEFYVRHAYDLSRETLPITVHGVIAFVTLLLLLIQRNMGGTFGVEQALWIYGMAQIMGAIVASNMAPLSLGSVSLTGLVTEFKEMWSDCKWGGVIGVMIFIRAQSHTVIVTALIGPIGVAKLNASRMLITPMAMLTPALSRIALPRLAAARAYGDSRVIKIGSLISMFLFVATVLYCSLLLSTYDLISTHFFNSKYDDVFSVTALWCIYLCAAAFRNGAEMSAQALGKNKNLGKVNAVSAVVGLTTTYWLTSLHGLIGSIIGLIVAESLMSLLLFLSLRSADVGGKLRKSE